jgi:predicted ATPase/DNA-binding winged helix-turn-helix (wHTH) protein
MPEQGRQVVYASGRWEIDLARRQLLSDGLSVPLGSRAFEIIEVLVESGGELVGKYDLMARVWPGAIVDENTLQFHVSAIRKALGADRGLLKTDSGRGYRLLGSWTARHAGKLTQPGDLDPLARPTLAFRTNVPVATSALVGRAQARQHLLDVLPAFRVVTLTGPGGIGKSVLGLEVARSLLPGFDGDCWLVELASLGDPALLPTAVASVLGLRVGGDEISAEAVARAIGGQKLLLMLDNCEHLIDAVARLTETVVRMCPHASVLATSREILRIDGEYVYRVPPLSVPPPHLQAATSVQEYGAVQLLIARAVALESGFTACPENLSTIAAICQCLDGIPLAIEFAAARVATLGLQQVAARLGDRFSLLTAGRRTALPRHRTLRATLDWSYELLPESERRLLRRLAIFAGGFSLEAAAAVLCDADATTSTVAERIASLVTKSLVALEGSLPSGRWRLLEIIRAYAFDRLVENGEAEHVARRHAEFFRDLMAHGRLSSTPLVFGFEETSPYLCEIDNVRAALDWAFSYGGDIAIGVVLTAAYGPVWLHMSLIAECRERTERALNRLDTHLKVSDRLRMQLHFVYGMTLLHTSGSLEKMECALAEALRISETLGDVDSQLRVLWALWTYRINVGDSATARQRGQEFLRAADRAGSPADLLVGDRLMGNAMHYAGNQPEARRYFERVLSDYAVPGDHKHSVMFLHDQRLLARARLARVRWLEGFVDQAKSMALDCLDEARNLDHVLSLCLIHAEVLFPIALLTGDLDTAARSTMQLIDIATKHSMALWIRFGRCLEGALVIAQGDEAKGAVLLREAINAFGATGQTVHCTGFLNILAEGLMRAGEPTRSIEVINEAFGLSTESSGNLWCIAETLRIKSELLLETRSELPIQEAEVCLQQALAVAREQGALFWELRAALSLARLLREQGRSTDALALLQHIHGRFTEGYDTRDLKAAKALLDACR